MRALLKCSVTAHEHGGIGSNSTPVYQTEAPAAGGDALIQFPASEASGYGAGQS
jgi:hypothetical protein